MRTTRPEGSSPRNGGRTPGPQPTRGMSGGAVVVFGVIFLLGIALGLFVAPSLFSSMFGSSDSDSTTTASTRKLGRVFRLVQDSYVEEVKAEQLAEDAIDGMLATLDPHSVYIGAERMKRIRERFNAEFEGIGISYEFIRAPEGRDTIGVLSVLEGGPSEEAGLLSGDRIVAISDSSAIGFSDRQVQQTLRGPEGTQVRVTLRRPGVSERIRVTITRDEIPLRTVDTAYMTGEHTGYIRVNRFARTTYEEFTGSLGRLEEEGMERLILDLRGNTGGYMNMALKLSDEFLAEGEQIVSQSSRHERFNETFPASAGGRWEGRPLVVLVDESSASASEIVAGALQDHDRALIVGRRTFGKGLVQKQYEVGDGSTLRLTIARFRTPSGRLIQTPYDDGSQEDYLDRKEAYRRRDRTLSLDEIIARAPEALKYTTDAGRTVLGGGGILPDYVIQPDTASPFMRAVQQQGVGEAFARRWLDRQGSVFHDRWEDRRHDFVERFSISDAMFEDFLALAEKRGLEIDRGRLGAPSEAGNGSEANTLSKESLSKESNGVAQGSRFLAGGSGSTHAFSYATVVQNRASINTHLKSRIALRLYGRSALYPVLLQTDPVFQEAQKHWGAARHLAALKRGE